MIRCKNCRFFEDGRCCRVFERTGNRDDLRLVDGDLAPCVCAEEPEE